MVQNLLGINRKFVLMADAKFVLCRVQYANVSIKLLTRCNNMGELWLFYAVSLLLPTSMSTTTARQSAGSSHISCATRCCRFSRCSAISAPVHSTTLLES